MIVASVMNECEACNTMKGRGVQVCKEQGEKSGWRGLE
jgi:predicted small secreted protein